MQASLVARRLLSTLCQVDELRYDDCGIEESEQRAEQAQRCRRRAHWCHVCIAEREHLSERIVCKQRVATVPVGDEPANRRTNAVRGRYRKVCDVVDARPRITGDDVSTDGAEHVLGADCLLTKQVTQNYPYCSPIEQ